MFENVKISNYIEGKAQSAHTQPDGLNVVILNFSNFKTYGVQFQEISSGLKGSYPSFEFEYNCMWSVNSTVSSPPNLHLS